ncbi:MAG: hypothetical protein R3C14_25490 [Caldilineaceae bacterium]
MKTGVSYMGHHNPKHMATDMREMQALQLDDLFLCMQEVDFVHFPGKIRFGPPLAREHGVRPLALFWGALNLFGGGRSSHFLLDHPECFQVGLDGSQRAAGCYNNPVAVAYIQSLIDVIAEAGFAGYFIDEPTPLRDCYCPACRAVFAARYDADLTTAPTEQQDAFRQQAVVDYVKVIADYCKANHPQLETFCCLMPHDDALWEPVAQIASLDNIGTDIYWTNNDRPLTEMEPILTNMAAVAQRYSKVHHEWLECWRANAGREARILAQGEVMVRHQPDALYVWAWEGQIGTKESCDNPQLAWAHACDVLRLAKG